MNCLNLPASLVALQLNDRQVSEGLQDTSLAYTLPTK